MSRYNEIGVGTLLERVTLEEVRIFIEPPRPRIGWYTLIRADCIFGNIEPGVTGTVFMHVGEVKSQYVFVDKEFRG